VADELAIINVYPDLLGTYGDSGNALALAHRAAARGIPVRVVDVGVDDRVPLQGDIYLLGGGEDAAQLLAARLLRSQSSLRKVLGSRPCLAVCAGLQLLAHQFQDSEHGLHDGLGVLDATCGRLAERAVGEIVTDPLGLPGVDTLTGFENHRGSTTLGPAARPLGRLVAGTGNGDGHDEGAVQGSLLATYLHGPVLVRNPALADLVLARAVGQLPAYHDHNVERLHRERLDAADPRRGRVRHALLGRWSAPA
jgi:CobQ-like glutamine amidotransferase family enzyme